MSNLFNCIFYYQRQLTTLHGKWKMFEFNRKENAHRNWELSDILVAPEALSCVCFLFSQTHTWFTCCTEMESVAFGQTSIKFWKII